MIFPREETIFNTIMGDVVVQYEKNWIPFRWLYEAAEML
jgi:hypothetical protein